MMWNTNHLDQSIVNARNIMKCVGSESPNVFVSCLAPEKPIQSFFKSVEKQEPINEGGSSAETKTHISPKSTFQLTDTTTAAKVPETLTTAPVGKSPLKRKASDTGKINNSTNNNDKGKKAKTKQSGTGKQSLLFFPSKK